MARSVQSRLRVSFVTRARRVALIVAAIPLVVLALVVVLIHVPPVRSYGLDKVEALVSDSLNGSLSLGELEGSPFIGGLELGPTRLEDDKGRALVTAQRATVDVAWFASIAEGAIVVEELLLEQPVIWMESDENGNSFSRLVKDPKTDTSTTPSFVPISIILRRAAIEDGKFTMVSPNAEPLVFDDIDTALSGRIDPETITADVADLAADSPLLAARTHVRGSVTVEPDELRGKVSAYDAAGTTLSASDIRLVYEGVGLHVPFEAEVDPATIAHYAPDVTAAAKLEGVLDHEPGGEWKLTARGAANDAPLTVTATAADAFDAVAARLEAGPGLDASSFLATLPNTDVAVEAEGRFTDLESPTGDARVSLSGTVASPTAKKPIDIRALDATVTLDDGAAHATVTMNAVGADLDGSARGNITKDGFELERAEAKFAVDRLSAVVGQMVDLKGAVRGDVTLRGPLTAPAIVADVRATNIAMAGVRAGRVHLEADLRGPLEDPRGRALVNAENLAVQDTLIGNVQLRALRGDRGPFDVTVTSENGKTVVERFAANLGVDLQPQEGVVANVRSLEATALGSDWSIAPGARIAMSKAWSRLVVTGLHLSTHDADLVLNTSIDFARARILTLDAEIPQVDIDTLRRAGFVPAGPGKGGLSANVDLKDGRLVVDTSVFGETLGHGHVQALVRMPKRPFEPAAWQRLSADDIERVEIELARLYVGEVQAMFGVVPVIHGAASGGFELVDGQLKRGAVDLFDGRIEGISKSLSFFASIQTPPETWARIRLSALLDGVPVLSTDTTVDLDPAKLRRDGVTALLAADFRSTTHLANFPLSAIERPNQLSGTVTGTVTLVRQGDVVDLDLDAAARDARWDIRWPPMNLSVEGDARDGEMSLSANLDAGSAGKVAFDVRGRSPRASADPAAWAKLGLDDVEVVDLNASNVHLDVWGDVFEMSGLQGLVSARAALAAGGRTGEAIVNIDGFSMRKSVDPVDGRIYIDTTAERTKLDASLFRLDRPLLDAQVETPLNIARLTSTSSEAIAQLPFDGTLRADEVPMELIAQALGAEESVDGTIDISGELHGTLAEPKFDAHIRSDRVRIGGSTLDELLIDVLVNKSSLIADAEMHQTAGGSLTLSGAIALTGDNRFGIDLAADEFDLSLLSLFSSSASATFGGVTGTLDGRVAMGGTPGAPRVDGKLRLADVHAVLVHPIPPMEGIKGELVFEQDHMTFAINGNSGDGDFRFEGQGDLTKRGFEMKSELEIDDVAIAAGPKILKTDMLASLDLVLADRLDIDVLVRDGTVKLPSKNASARLPIDELEHVVMVDELKTEAPPVERKKKDEEAGAALAYRIRIRTAGQLPIRSTDLNANLVADIVIAQSDGVPATTGFVEITSGTVNLFGRQWVIDTADVRLAAGRDNAPRLDVRVRHDFPSVSVFVSVSGSPENPRVRFSSDPGIYSQDQLIGFVLGGTPNSASSDAPLADQAVGAATGFLLGQVQTKLQDKLPIDTISVDLDDSASAEAVSVGKWISSRVFVAYNHRIAAQTDENANAGLIQFRLGRGWMLETTYGDRGNGSADILYRKRF